MKGGQRITEQLRDPDFEDTSLGSVHDYLRSAGFSPEGAAALTQEIEFWEGWCPCCDEQEFYRWAEKYLDWAVAA